MPLPNYKVLFQDAEEKRRETQTLYDAAISVAQENRKRHEEETKALREKIWHERGRHEQREKELERNMEATAQETETLREVKRRVQADRDRCLGWIAHARGKHPLDKEGLPDPDFVGLTKGEFDWFDHQGRTK